MNRRKIGVHGRIACDCFYGCDHEFWQYSYYCPQCTKESGLFQWSECIKYAFNHVNYHKVVR